MIGFLRLLLFTFCWTSFGGLEASSSQTDLFLRSLRFRAQPYALPFFELGLGSTSYISFQEGPTAKYRLFTNSMVLPNSHAFDSQSLHPFYRQNPIQLGTLAHESFHAFVANFIRRDPRYHSMNRWMEIRSQNLYRDLELSSSKNFVALEEAYASFIDAIYMTVRNLEAYLDRASRSDEGFDCSMLFSFVNRSWQTAWHHPIYGYYYNDSLVDNARAFWARFTGRDGPVLDEEQFVEISIQRADRDWISREIFLEEISEDPLQTFGFKFEAIGCPIE
ncbi:MAG: hypothetical protein EA369_05395 [Bradymonadales bacterium]|nr:MAG: hypothetical protein EA369_05395 [Bradymonadales bacterium]